MSDVIHVNNVILGLLEPGQNGETHQLYFGNDARNRDHSVEAPADYVATFDQDTHRWALKHMHDILGAKVVASAVVEEAPR